jgi:phosphonate transport system ATP-binding protein
MAIGGSPAITLDRVSRTFGATRALDRISLHIPPGQFVAVIGRSGAGKTTLLRCLAAATPPTEGTIRVGEVDLATLGGPQLRVYRAHVAMIYQQFNLVRRLRVLDNVLAGRLAHQGGWRDRRHWMALLRWFTPAERGVALRCLDHVGLLGRAWQRTDTLSGGEQQRVAIARALTQAPGLILADEPVASLDPINGTQVLETLRDTASVAGLTVVATLHHLDYARRYSDRIVALAGGRLVFDGAPADLTDAGVSRILDEATRTPAPAAPAVLARTGWAAS